MLSLTKTALSLIISSAFMFAGDPTTWPVVWSRENTLWWKVSNAKGQWMGEKKKTTTQPFVSFLPSLKLPCEWFAFAVSLGHRALWNLWKLNPSEESLSFQSMSSWLRPYLVSCQLFTSVFGVGPKTAEKWYRGGMRSFSDILTEPGIRLNRMQRTGTSTSHHHTQITEWKFQTWAYFQVGL